MKILQLAEPYWTIAFNAENIAKEVLLYVFNIAVPASLYQLFRSTIALAGRGF